MQAGVEAHAKQDYDNALTYRLQAYELGNYPQSWDKGRAARDVAASYDRLGDTGLAELYAGAAYEQHARLNNQGIEQGSREFTVSAMYAAIIAARQNRRSDALRFIGEAWGVSESLRGRFGQPHQYDVNLVGRVAGIEGTFSKPTKQTRDIGSLAVQWAKISETNQVKAPNPRLSRG